MLHALPPSPIPFLSLLHFLPPPLPLQASSTSAISSLLSLIESTCNLVSTRTHESYVVDTVYSKTGPFNFVVTQATIPNTELL